MKRLVKSLLCLALALTMVLPMAACRRKPKEVEELHYPGEDDMTVEELLEMDRKNPITIQIMVEGLTDPASKDSPVLKAIAERTGTTIELVNIDTDKLQMLMASKKYPDVLVMNRNATFSDYMKSGDLVNLEPLLQKWAPTVYEMNYEMVDLFKNDKGELLYLTENNDLLREGEHHPEDATDPTRAQNELPWGSCAYVQYPLAAKYTDTKVTSFDQYKALLDAYIADHQGQERCYAVSFDKGSAGDILWAGLTMYGYKCVYKGGLYVTKDGENYTYGLKAEDTLDWLLFLNQLYREGYVYTDAPVQSSDQLIRQMNKTQVFSFIGNYYAVYEANKALAANKSESSYIPLKLQAEGVDQIYQYNAAYTGAGAFTLMRTSPYKARVCRLLEYLYSDEGSVLHGWGIEGEDYIINAEGKRDLTPEIAAQKSTGDYDLKRGIRALYGVVNFPTYTTDGQPAFARFAPYFDTDAGIDERDKIIRADPVFNWHEDWKGTFWSDLSEMDMLMSGESEAATASARCAGAIKDLINKIIMAPTEAECRKLYEEAVKTVNTYGIEKWEEAINQQIHEKREKLGM